jgi:mono/diheme cytochrome c family protein
MGRITMLRTVLMTVLGLAVLALGGAAAVVYGGLYNVSATQQHYQPVYSLLETAMHNSVRLRARSIEPPALDAPQMLQRGAACFRDKCVQCHGGPGVAQGDIGKSMQPLPGPLVDARQRWLPRELYWVTRHGIRMSGMPAWEFRLDERDLWAVVAFMQVLPDLTARQFADATSAQAGRCEKSEGSQAPQQSVNRAGDVDRGRIALYQHACSACHTIPGITGSSPQVGPPLAGVASRQLIAGRLANNPQNMAAWLRAPKKFDPQTTMPDLDVGEADAQDMAAYLATLR